MIQIIQRVTEIYYFELFLFSTPLLVVLVLAAFHDLALHGLELGHLRGDGGQLVLDPVPLAGHVLVLDVADVQEYLVASRGDGRHEPVTALPAKTVDPS